MSSQIVVTIAGRRLATLRSLTLSRTYEMPSNHLTLDVIDPGVAGQGLPPSEAARRRRIFRESLELDGRVEVHWQDRPIFTGALEHVSNQWSISGTRIALTARSLVTGLDQAAVIGTAFVADTPIEEALAFLTTPFGVPVTLGAGVASGMPLGRFIPRHGERLLGELIRLCRARGLTLTETGDGALVLDRPRYGGTVPTLKTGRAPVLEVAVEFDVTRRSSKVKAHGQRQQGPGHDPETATRGAENLSDPGMKRNRPIEVLAAGLADIDTTVTLADVIRRERVRDALRVRLQLAGWSVPGRESTIWWPGDRLNLVAPDIDLDRTLVIQSAIFTWSPAGQTVSLSLAPIEGFNVNATGEDAPRLSAAAAAAATFGGTSAALVAEAVEIVSAFRI